MKVVHSRIVSAHWARDFGRVEARVHLLVQDSPNTMPRGESLLVSVPAKGEGSLRGRLLQEARLMAGLMSRVEQSLRSAVAA